jgi:hypothetical protein
MLFVSVFGMKLVSYAYINNSLRWDARINKVENGWPQNLKFRSILYFIIVPFSLISRFFVFYYDSDALLSFGISKDPKNSLAVSHSQNRRRGN